MRQFNTWSILPARTTGAWSTGVTYTRTALVDEWDRMTDVKLKGVLYGIAAALPYMQRQKSGHVINVSSVIGHKVGPGFAVYAATKFAMRALSEGL